MSNNLISTKFILVARDTIFYAEQGNTVVVVVHIEREFWQVSENGSSAVPIHIERELW